MSTAHTAAPTFERAQREYHNLPHVAIDALNENTVDDLVFRARHEIDMHGERIAHGEEGYAASDLRLLRSFIKKWKSHAALTAAQGE